MTTGVKRVKPPVGSSPPRRTRRDVAAEATERAINAGGWFLSGDLGRLDAEGNLQVVGRRKDIIIRGGHNIHPAHIEDMAMRHPLVQKAPAIPVAILLVLQVDRGVTRRAAA